MMRRWMAGVALALGLVLPLGSAEAVDSAYKLQPGDTLTISVVNKIDAVSYKVNPDGWFTMPMIGDVVITDKNLEQLREELTIRLAEFVKEPEVVVALGTGGIEVNVLGEISKPGKYSLARNCTLLDAISKANGFTRRAAKRKVVVIHKGEEKPYAVVNVQDIVRGKKGAVNPVLQEGDLVYVEGNHRLNIHL